MEIDYFYWAAWIGWIILGICVSVWLYRSRSKKPNLDLAKTKPIVQSRPSRMAYSGYRAPEEVKYQPKSTRDSEPLESVNSHSDTRSWLTPTNIIISGAATSYVFGSNDSGARTDCDRVEEQTISSSSSSYSPSDDYSCSSSSSSTDFSSSDFL